MLQKDHLAPLQNDDEAVIQDFLLTKFLLLVAQNARIAEWRFEYGIIQASSAEQWERNHFLLDYTLTRCLSVLAPTTPATRELFVEGIIDAVRGEKFALARSIWLSAQNEVNSTVLLVAALTTEPLSVEQIQLFEVLPAPYVTCAKDVREGPGALSTKRDRARQRRRP